MLSPIQSHGTPALGAPATRRRPTGPPGGSGQGTEGGPFLSTYCPPCTHILPFKTSYGYEHQETIFAPSDHLSPRHRERQCHRGNGAGGIVTTSASTGFTFHLHWKWTRFVIHLNRARNLQVYTHHSVIRALQRRRVSLINYLSNLHGPWE